MKITKTRLRQIIKEEIESIQEINNMPTSKNARSIPLSEAMLTGERGRGLYITTETVDKIKQTFKQSMTAPLSAGYHEVVDHALEDGVMEEDAEDMAVATLQVVIDEAMKDFRVSMGHFDGWGFAEAVERAAGRDYDSDADDDDDDDDFWGQERLSHEEREKFLAAFYTIEEAVKDGRLDNSVMDPVLHLLSCVGIYL